MSPVVGTPMVRKEDPRLLTGEARYVDDLVIPGARYLGMVRSPEAHARITSIDTSGALERARRRGRVHRRGPPRRLGGADAVRMGGHGGHEEPRAPAGRGRQGQLPRRHRRGRRGELALRGARRRRRGDRRLRVAAAVGRPRGRGQRPRGHPRGRRHQQVVHVDADPRSDRGRAGVRIGRAHGARALHPAAPDPRGDGAARRRASCRNRSAATWSSTRRRRSPTSSRS